jgi:RNA polymerase sigma-70 factor, ECF subfamily
MSAPAVIPASARPPTAHGANDVAPTVADLERHRPALRAHCRRILGGASEADDAVQETLLRAWRSRRQYAGRSSVSTWLHRIAANVCTDMRSAPQRRAPAVALTGARNADEPAAPQAGPADLATVRDELHHRFGRTFDALPPRQRAVLVLRDAFGWSAADVAELLGTTTAAVNSALQRAREACRRQAVS